MSTLSWFGLVNWFIKQGIIKAGKMLQNDTKILKVIKLLKTSSKHLFLMGNHLE